MTGPIRRKKGGGGRSSRLRFPKRKAANRRGHTIRLLTIVERSACHKNVYALFKTRLAEIPKTPSALLAVMPSDLKAFQTAIARIDLIR